MREMYQVRRLSDGRISVRIGSETTYLRTKGELAAFWCGAQIAREQIASRISGALGVVTGAITEFPFDIPTPASTGGVE